MEPGKVIYFPTKVKSLLRLIHRHHEDEKRKVWSAISVASGVQFDSDSKMNLSYNDKLDIWKLEIIHANSKEESVEFASDMDMWGNLSRLESLNKLIEELAQFFCYYHFPEARKYVTAVDFEAGCITVGERLVDTSLIVPPGGLHG